jgi:IS30 family transposase
MLTLSDREEISRGLAEGLLYKEIGRRMGRDSSVVSREVTRHGGRSDYRATTADTSAGIARARPKQYAVERSPWLHAVVHDRLRQGWSPASATYRAPGPPLRSPHHRSVNPGTSTPDDIVVSIAAR